MNLTCAVTYNGAGTAKNPPTCALNPTQVQVSSSSAGSSTLTVSTGATKTAMLQHGLRDSGIAFAAMFCIVLVPLRRKALFLVLLSFVALGGAIGCGSGGSSTSTSPGSYSVVVTAASSTVTTTTTISLTVQ